MKYRVQFQYRARDNDRPYDHGQEFDLTGGDNELMVLPDIGDHVNLPSEGGADRGVVENRLFTYMPLGGVVTCFINIVLTDSDVDSGKLMKS